MSLCKFDTHVHTSETSPCGIVDGKALVSLYKEAGYDGIVITDHYFNGFFESIDEKNWEEKVDMYLRGYMAARTEGEKVGLRVILGMEIRFKESYNDYLVYGIDEAFLIENKELYKLGLFKFKELIKDKGILIYQAHPYRIGMKTSDPLIIDGVEVYNGNMRHHSFNEKALLFAENNNLKMISGSDFHQVEDLARGGIVLGEQVMNSKELVKLLSEDKIIEIISSK
jgi:predicted metal-dependent phosphoesterase TrpH